MPYIDRETKKRYNANYYKKVRKQKGQGEKKLVLHIKIGASLLGRLNRLVLDSLATGRYPWKTISDCCSTLLVAGLKAFKTGEDDDPIAEMLPHLETMQHLQRIRTIRQEAMTILNSAREEIAALLGIGAKDGAVNYYHVTMEQFRQIPSTEWSNWAVKELEKAFPQLAKERPKGLNLEPPEKVATTFGRRKGDPHKAKKIPLRHK